jgi:carboxyl-terminal processing protease
MFFKRSTGFLMTCVLCLCLVAGRGVLADKVGPDEQEIPYEALRSFTEIFGRIKAHYVEEVDDEELLKNAIRGMLSGLDPHSTYLDPDAFTNLQESTAGEFGGLGIEVTMEDGFVKVVSPIDDTPAQRAGVQSGDLIIRIDEKPVKGMELSEAVTLLRGKPGTKTELTIVRDNTSNPIILTVERAIIHIKSVRARLLEPGYGYVRISTFQVRSGPALIEAIEDLYKENKLPLKGLILDLRNNPGGVLSSAVEVADAFLDDGLIVYTKGRTNEADLRQNATPGDVLHGAPMVVLINGGSASASEIVAGAIQDHVRGIIMGYPSFGKGSVQTILELENDYAIKLTTAHYFTPSGRSIQAEGIVPDIKLSRAKLELLDRSGGMDPLRESSLSRHLNNPNHQDVPEETDRDTTGDEAPGEENLSNPDYELFEALNLLKGLNIMQVKGEKNSNNT